jgi:hypothetical protein
MSKRRTERRKLVHSDRSKYFQNNILILHV